MAHTAQPRRRILIMGAAGRDFHNFNTLYRDDPAADVVAFTAAQIPGIGGRRYPAELAGSLYPQGVPIHDEAELEAICKERAVAQVDFAYSDVPHAAVMHAAARAQAVGCDFHLPGPEATQLRSTRPVVAVCAVRTGCGKSQITRYLSRHLARRGLRVAAIRHPMPYGDLASQAVQRFASATDLDGAHCTLEEREEYEPHIAAGSVVFAGVDYAAILARAEGEADLILWDGGNNDFSFIKPDLMITLVDALRPDQLATHHPGETTLRLADIVVVAKADAVPSATRAELAGRLSRLLPDRAIVEAASPVTLDDPAAVAGKRVLVVEDGPTITHGGMPWGAGYTAVDALPGVTLVDPRDHAHPDIARVFEAYAHIGPVLPAMGYGDKQIAALQATINGAEADVVVAATPIDLARQVDLRLPVVRARYRHADCGDSRLADLVDARLADAGLIRQAVDPGR